MDDLPFGVGDVVADKFRLERVVGRGGMGVVFAAQHLELGELVALKFLRPDLVDSSERVSRFVQEARAAARLKGANIVRVHDVGTLDSQVPYMVMEYLDGEDLRQVVHKHGPVAPEDAVVHVVEVCLAMAEAHGRGIIHRDIKPKNLFLTRGLDGKPLVKVLDFGICKLADGTNPDHDETRADATMGSPNFISPEQMRSAKNVDVRTDIWALGAVLYYLLAGRPPFRAETLPELCLKVMNDPPEPLATDAVDGALEAIVLRCLDKSPDRRPRNAGELARALAPFGGARAAEILRRGERVFAEAGDAGGVVDRPSDASATLPSVAPGETLATGALDVEPAPRRRWLPVAMLAALGAAATVAAVVWMGGRTAATAEPDAGAADAEPGVVEGLIDASPAPRTTDAASLAVEPDAPPVVIDAAPSRPTSRPPRRPPTVRVDAGPASAPPDAAPRPDARTPAPEPDAAPVRPRLDPRDRRD